jgi:putative intracellular protease/amidase
MAGKTIGFIFIQGFADWEFGFLAAAAKEWFGLNTVALTPGGAPVVSIGGFSLSGQRGQTPAENADLDAVAVIGSDVWAESPPDVAPLLYAVEQRGGVVGGICAGTLPLARAGLLKDHAHTSNGRAWILGHVPDYAGAERYQDVPHAVADGRLVTAPGSAPATFAAEMLQALYPEKTAQLAEMRTFLGSEFRGAAGS